MTMENRIRALRKSLGLSQEELAKGCGVSRQTINAIENNKYDPSLALAFHLARELETTVDALFIPNDNTVASALPVLPKFGSPFVLYPKIPVSAARCQVLSTRIPYPPSLRRYTTENAPSFSSFRKAKKEWPIGFICKMASCTDMGPNSNCLERTT